MAALDAAAPAEPRGGPASPIDALPRTLRWLLRPLGGWRSGLTWRVYGWALVQLFLMKVLLREPAAYWAVAARRRDLERPLRRLRPARPGITVDHRVTGNETFLRGWDSGRLIRRFLWVASRPNEPTLQSAQKGDRNENQNQCHRASRSRAGGRIT